MCIACVWLRRITVYVYESADMSGVRVGVSCVCIEGVLRACQCVRAQYVYESAFLSGVRVGVSCVWIKGVYRVCETQYAEMSACVRVCISRVCECCLCWCA